LQYQYNGHTVTGKLFKKSPNSTDANPIWIVTPSDKRRRNEDVSEQLLGKVVTEAEAAANRGPKLKPENKVTPESSSSPKSNSEEEEEEIEEEEPTSPKRRSGRTTPSSTSSGKRKSDESKNSGSGGGKANKKQKGAAVTFTQESDTSKAKSTKDTKAVGKKKKLSSRKIGTRSKGGTTEMLLLPEIVTKKKTPSKTKKIKKGDNVTVVKMLTGKSAFVLFNDMNSCVQYRVSTSWLFYLTFDCLY